MLTTGFTAATLSYDFDTDPKKRAKNSEFYGYVPDSAKKVRRREERSDEP